MSPRFHIVLLLVGLMVLWPAGSAQAQTGLAFSFGNVQETPDSLAFDVLVTGAAPATRLGDTQVYLNYNAQAFGEAVAYNDHLRVALAPALRDQGRYRPPVVNDNTAARVSLTIEYVGQPGEGLSLSSDSALPLMRIVLTRTDAEAPAEVVFDDKLMTGQQFEADMATAYAPLLMLPFPDGAAATDSLHDAVGTIRQISGGLIAVVPDARPSTRYVPQNLPAAFREDGLRVVFSGWLEEIPPNVRMAGVPLVLTAMRRAD